MYFGRQSTFAAADGGVLHFQEEAVHQWHDRFLLISAAYRRQFGRFSGTLPGGIVLREAHGMMERYRARW